jgi:predicted ATPase
VPLFVEELTRMMVESGVLVEHGDHYAMAGSLSDVEIPGTLRALITVRLDRLERAKETAQVAAALGREFSVEVLSAVSPLGPAAVAEDLDRLMTAGLVLRKRRQRDPVGVFKHALVRDAAYESLGRAARQKVHATIARTLEERFPEMVRTRPDLLAHHHAAAEQKREAVRWGSKAVQQAMGRSAYVEAVRWGKGAMGWLGAVEDVAEREEMELSVGSQMTLALLAQDGAADDELRRVAARTLELVDGRGDDSQFAPMLWRLLLYYLNVSPLAAREVAERLLSVAQRTQDAGQEAALLAIVGNCLLTAGRFEEALTHLERCLAVYDPAAHRASALNYGIDTKVCAVCALATLRWIVGYPDRALREAEEAVSWARTLNHPLTLSNALLSLAGAHRARMEREETAHTADVVLRNAERHGRAMVAYHGILRAWATGDLSEGRQHLAVLKASGEKLAMTSWIATVAEIETARGESSAALAHLEECMQLAAQTGETYGLPELHRLKASALLACGDRSRAESCLREAITVAQLQGARSAELRAAVVLGELLRDSGRRDELERLLRPLHDWFAEGRELQTMIEARALLER